MVISIIVAVDENWGIGLHNKLLWHLPNDLKLFKQITTNHTIIMGRKTYESIGKALPNRRNIVISRIIKSFPNVEVYPSIDEALDNCKNEKEVFIIGGAEIYKQSLAIAHKIYLTQIHHHFKADVFFPALNFSEWKEINQMYYPKDKANIYDFTFKVLEKNI